MKSRVILAIVLFLAAQFAFAETIVFSKSGYQTQEVTAVAGDTNIVVNLVAVTSGSLRGWQVNATNTGLAGVGVNKNSLPLYPGGAGYRIPAGSSISMMKLLDPDLSAGNLTIDRCWIVNTGWYPQSSASGTVTIRDSDIEQTSYQSSPVGCGAGDQPITILRCNISGGQALVYVQGPGTVQQCYLHNMISAAENHCDGFTRRSGTNQFNFVDNHLDSYTNPDHTSATIFLQDTFGYFDNLLFQGNLLSNGANGGGTLVLEKKNGNGYGTHLVVDNNRFTGSGSGCGYVWDYTTNSRGLGWGQWTNNYRNDPSKLDNKGAVVAEP